MSLFLHNRKLLTTCFSTIAFSLIWLTSTAINADDFTKRFYLNGGVGISQLEPESSSDALSISDDTDTGFHLGVGVDLSRFISLEAYAAVLGAAEVDFLGADVGTIDYTVFGLSALGYVFNSRSGLVFGDEDTSGLFRREGASLYGRLGIGHLENDTERVSFTRDHPTHLAFGVGVEYGFSNGVALRTELMSLDTDARYLNVGLVKRFGRVAPLAVATALPLVVEQKVEVPAVDEPVVFKPVVAPYIYFAFDESELTPESTLKLDELASLLVDKDLKLQVEGHTDWIAPEAYNMSLSVRRAEAVANYLQSRGISGERITTVGYGEVRPISDNDTADGRALNRRTEIVLQ